MSDQTIENIEKEIEIMETNLQRKKETLEEKKKQIEDKKLVIVERLEKNKTYYFIDDECDSRSACEDKHKIDNQRHRTYNYFHTEIEAEVFGRKDLLFRKVIRARDKVRYGFDYRHINYNFEFLNLIVVSNIVMTEKVISNNQLIPLMFKDQDQVNLFRQLITDEEIIAFYKM